MKQSDFKLKHKSTKTIGQPQQQQQKVCVSLRMSLAEREMILNRKTDRDLSNNIFLMRIIRRYFAEHKEGLEVKQSGVMGPRATNHKSPPTPPTSPTPSTLVTAPTADIGGLTDGS